MVDPLLGNSSDPELDADTPPIDPHPVTDEVRTAASRIAAALDEPLVWLVENAVKELGIERADTFLQETLNVEAQGGMPRAHGDQRRTPGGVFFLLIKQQAGSDEVKRIFKGPRAASSENGAGRKQPGDPLPIAPLSWDEARGEMARLLKLALERASVKITLVGRPTQVSKTKSCVVVALKGSRPPSLPKGLPPAPDGSDFSYAVFISLRHWAKVAPVMAHDKDERLLVEGYPIFDPKRGVTVILAQNVRTVNFAKRAHQSA
jgi:hypothetical protein